jgi:hypothetical protein
MFHTLVRAASLLLIFTILPISEAFAHCFVGARFLPVTLITDDPCIADDSFVTTGFISPGVIWIGDYFQVGVEALIPVNNQSGSGVGVVGQMYLYLDDIFPTTYGQPLIGASTSPSKLPFGG